MAIPIVSYTRQGYSEGYLGTVEEAKLGGLRPSIVCCIKFRLIESFQTHRHIGERAAASRYPQIAVR